VGALVTALADRMGAAILCTASGRGVVDESSPWFLGLSGLYAAEPAVEILKAADLVVALGSQLEETTTYGWPEPPPPMLQVNVTASELSPRFRGQSLLADVSAALRSWSGRDCSRRGDEAGVSSWREEVRSARRDIMAGPLLPTASGPTEPPRVREVLAAVDSVVPAPRVSLHENGLQDMWSYFFPAWQVRGGSDCLVPSEQTPLGFAFAAAPGAVLAAQGRPVVVIGGDGAFSAALSDLATLAEVRCPLLLVVLANGGFGWLEVNLRNRAGSGSAADVSFLRSRRPHAAVSAAYGIPHVRCGERRELPEAVQAAWSRCRSGGPVVLEVEVSLTDVPPGMEQLAGDFPGAASLVEVG
jgi:acetolactate synthase-1/2/3 large subunit